MHAVAAWSCAAALVGPALPWSQALAAPRAKDAAKESAPAERLEAEQEPASPDAATERAAELYRRGLARYETSDYDGAIELWTEAYASLDPTAENRSIRNDLVYNISSAQVKAFELDSDIKHLRQAKILLERYVEVHLEMYGREGTEEELVKVEERIEDFKRQIADYERAHPESREQVRPPRADDPSRPTGKRATVLMGVGGALVGLGVAGIATMGAGLAIGNQADRDFVDDPANRDEHERRGKQANVIAIVGGVTGGLFAAAGAVLLGLGIRERKRVQANAAVVPGSFTVGLTARF